ncbi:MAG TPA: hypothetical protein DD490_34260 [Acidobacteria bacterium]|nr:hypothetical protein [Acidobacteriota bacterium]
MSYLQLAATASPQALLRETGFWRSNRAYVAVIAGGVLSMVALRRLTYQESDSWMWLTLLIQLLVFWGAAVGARALAGIEVDDAIARLVELRASTELGQIKGGLKDRVLLDRIGTDFLPHNPSHDKGVLRLFQHILCEARDRKFHATEVVMQPYREGALGDLLRIQTVQKIALQLGILGTFAGLILAMQELSGAGQNLMEASSLNLLFGALHVSFATSVAGLEVAIVLAVALLVVRRRQERYFHNMESACATLTSLARSSIIQDEFLVELEQTRSTLAQVGDRIREQTREVEVQTGAIRSGLNDLAGLRTDFDSFLEKIRQEQGVVVAEMKSVYELISPRRVADELRQSLEAANRQLATSFREDLRSSLSELGQVNTALQLVKELGEQEKASREEQRQSLQASRATFEKGLAELTGATERLQQDLMTRLDRKLPMTSPVSMPAPPPAAALPQEAVRSLERIARGFENLAREIERNNGLLGEVVSAHSFYRTVMRRPREWWAGLRRMLTRRGGVNESEGLP